MPTVKRSPRISLRAERAEVTRRRIADAARQLFASRGYGATTLNAIAVEADVAVQTVYAVYGSKAGILRSLRESVLRQPEATTLFEQAVKEGSIDRKLELFARSIRRRWEFGHDIVAINDEAARTDRDVRQEVDKVVAGRRHGLGRLARSITGGLARDADMARTTAILNALTLTQVYRELVDLQGWTPDEFEAWLGTTLKQQLVTS